MRKVWPAPRTNAGERFWICTKSGNVGKIEIDAEGRVNVLPKLDDEGFFTDGYVYDDECQTPVFVSFKTYRFIAEYVIRMGEDVGRGWFLTIAAGVSSSCLHAIRFSEDEKPAAELLARKMGGHVERVTQMVEA